MSDGHDQDLPPDPDLDALPPELAEHPRPLLAGDWRVRFPHHS
jgi:hypothetical protein